MVKCQDIVEEWLAKHYRCYGTSSQVIVGATRHAAVLLPSQQRDARTQPTRVIRTGSLIARAPHRQYLRQLSAKQGGCARNGHWA